jgi:hypothetical protein
MDFPALHKWRDGGALTRILKITFPRARCAIVLVAGITGSAKIHCPIGGNINDRLRYDTVLKWGFIIVVNVIHDDVAPVFESKIPNVLCVVRGPTVGRRKE